MKRGPKIGYKQSLEHIEKRRLSQSLTMSDPLMREKHHQAVLVALSSSEVRERMSVSQREAQNRPEVKKKISLAHLGNQYCLGKKNALGSVLSEETRRKISRGHIGQERTSEVREKISRGNRGKKRTEEVKSRISQRMKGNPPPLGSGPRSVKWLDYRRKDGRIVKLQGSYELSTARYLDSIGEEWECVNKSREHSFLLSTGQRYYPDFYLKRLDLYIDPKGYWRDEEKLALVEKEYPGRVVFLVGETYLEQLKVLVEELDRV